MNYKIVRMKRKRLTIIIENGEITVKAPKSATVAHIESFVSQKSAWIEKKLAEHARRAAVLGGVLDYSNGMLGGTVCDITLSDAHKRIKAEDGIIYMPTKYADKEAQKKALKAWYKREAERVLEQRLQQLSAFTGLSYKAFALTNAKSKWGSCDAQCGIRLNWRLVMLSPALVDYVIIHELSHTAHHDHSAAFWATVGKFYPDFKAARKALKTYSALTGLYR
ncbi:MAG: M48 family metallopeptidase [Clostridiales bacterium]|nr:M48 family metallopeptidase [Clostridiales bacterium]